MPPSDVYARMVGRNERERDADILAAPELVVRVEEMEREADNGGLGSKRNIALIEIQPDPEDFLAVVRAHGDSAHIAHGGGVRTGNGACQSETGDLLALRKRLQIALLLLVGAEMFDQFARAERVRHHDHDGGVRVARGNLAQDHGLSLGRKTEPAMLLGNQHAEEALVADELQDVLGDAVAVVPDFPVVQLLAQLLGLVVEEALLLRRQHDRIDGAQLAPVGAAGEKLRVEALRPSVERFLFGFRNRRKNALNRFEGRACDDRAPDGPKR